ncbi:5'-methylthioadenosine/S-adenosylhomocysteine nucleosidase [Virgibacillus sp. NKC19-3]|uniref:5'-methylthioadenosine/S-adenosylhomocysteine nucleosidase n=1 Tax=Virgibacillus saliphilus TaxID=2831674 RepID=UPI001C9ADCE3|nr:5'-methylthioadenosine/S-adenosylhomocysteine nucleosidase [Virgibacillus sp. NKC19-3]MBY7143307.1 5'-methylthioadenosine/S-adenosylhomocysteine nucleosidase [Virgibacillus sp. NKC19-3]
MTIGIIGAMDEEVALLMDNMVDKEEKTIANCLFVRGMLLEKEVVLLKSGIGKVNAAMATTIMHERFSPSHIINTGSAGGFTKNLEVGDVVISTEVVHHDVDATAFEYAYGQVPGMPAMYAADAGLIAKAITAVKELNIQYEEGIISTGDSFMDDPNRVAFVHEKFPAMIAAEMEAAAVAQVCYQYNKPFVIIRALSDIAGKQSSVTFDAFLGKAAKNAANLIMSILKEME